MPDQPAFTPALFRFLRDLRKNNDRDWFLAHREVYERGVREPALRFIAAFAAPLRRFAPHLVADARPRGGSLFRIHRDIRFAKTSGRTRPTSASTSATRAPRARTRRASTCTSSPATCSRAPASGSPTAPSSPSCATRSSCRPRLAPRRRRPRVQGNVGALRRGARARAARLRSASTRCADGLKRKSSSRSRLRRARRRRARFPGAARASLARQHAVHALPDPRARPGLVGRRIDGVVASATGARSSAPRISRPTSGWMRCRAGS